MPAYLDDYMIFIVFLMRSDEWNSRKWHISKQAKSSNSFWDVEQKQLHFILLIAIGDIPKQCTSLDNSTYEFHAWREQKSRAIFFMKLYIGMLMSPVYIVVRNFQQAYSEMKLIIFSLLVTGVFSANVLENQEQNENNELGR